MDQTKWKELMVRVGIEENINTYQELVSQYNHKNRYYHNFNHIKAVLNHLDQAKHLAKDYNALEIALWFHDAIYKVFSSTNEIDSANWAVTFLNNNNVCSEFSDKVYALIMSTLHDATSTDNDERLMVDIDLTILGSSPEAYCLFESWIRKEYKYIPGFVYKKKRKQILVSFLERKKIYSHAFFYEKLENQARTNITNAIKNL